MFLMSLSRVAPQFPEAWRVWVTSSGEWSRFPHWGHWGFLAELWAQKRQLPPWREALLQRGREAEGRAHLRLRDLMGTKWTRDRIVSEHCYAISGHYAEGLVILRRTKSPGQGKASQLRSHLLHSKPSGVFLRCCPWPPEAHRGGHLLANKGQGHPGAEHTGQCGLEGPAEVPAWGGGHWNLRPETGARL